MTNLKKHVWEGWTVEDFIDELEFILDLIQSGGAIEKPKRTRKEIRNWLKENQPYYKKEIPELVEYFCSRYKI